jgi:hypothetical protein
MCHKVKMCGFCENKHEKNIKNGIDIDILKIGVGALKMCDNLVLLINLTR